MSAGKGRILLQHGIAIKVNYEYTQSRRAGLVEGFVSGRFARVPRAAFFSDIELVCQDGVKLQLAITMHSDTIVTFTGTTNVPHVAEELPFYPRARRSG